MITFTEKQAQCEEARINLRIFVKSPEGETLTSEQLDFMRKLDEALHSAASWLPIE